MWMDDVSASLFQKQTPGLLDGGNIVICHLHLGSHYMTFCPAILYFLLICLSVYCQMRTKKMFTLKFFTCL